MDPSDKLLLRSLLEGSLQEEDRPRVDDLLNRSEEARLQLSEWRGWNELDISFISTHKPIQNESALLQLAIQKIQSEVSGIGPKIANRTASSQELAQDSELDIVESGTAWSSHLTGITVGGVIGRGAMGVVHEGFDQTLGRRVAIKIPSRHCVRNPESRERFTREAQAAAQLCHENIVAIHSIQHVEGMPILVQQFIDGETLSAKVGRTGPLSAGELIELAKQIASGLASAHAAGIVHRDLKPENLLIERSSNVVRIADFGLAKRESSSLLTQPNVVAGTPAYMSPEQTVGQPLDGRSDLFSFGSVLRFAATGQPPFGIDETDVVLNRIRTDNVESLKKLRPDLPIAVCNTFDRLLIKDITQRTASATEFLKQLSEQRTPDSHWSVKSIALAGSVALVMSALLLWGFLAGGKSEQVSKRTTDSKRDGLSAITLSELPFGIRGVESRFRSLEEAVRGAFNGQEITIDHNGPFETSRIDIKRKRLSIVASDGVSPLFVPKKGPLETNQQFLTSDSDLHVSGIRVEWPIEIEVTDFQKLFEMPAIFCFDGDLSLDDCAIRRGTTGICAHGSRSMRIRRCTFEGGSHCLGWTAQGGTVTVENSKIRGRNGCLLFFPPPSPQNNGSGKYTMVDVGFVGETAIELGLTRSQTNSIQIQAENCVFDNPILLSLIASPPLARQVAIPQSMLTLMRGTLNWDESNCRHRFGQTYLSSRMLRQPERRYSSELVDLETWRKQWQTDFPGSTEIDVLPRIESR